MAIEFTHAAWDGAAIDGSAARFGSGSRGYAYDPADEFYPGEPIGPPPRRRGRVKTAIFLLILAAVGWGLWETNAAWRPWATAASNRIMAEWERRQAAPTAMTPAPLASPQPPQPLEPLSMSKEVAAVSGTALNPPGAEPVVAPAQAPVDEAPQQDRPEAAKPAPLPEPQIDPADPYQKRAAAIGLHPQISSAVLSSLTDTDYRNARTAIRKALAETADTEKYIWPLKPEAKAAVFQIHFVTGDRSECRRYIVTVLKNGWTTTAPPMEKCGIAPPKRSAEVSRNEGRGPVQVR